MTERVVSALRTHLLHNYLPGAPRNEVTAALVELANLMEKDAPLLSARKPHRADLISTITITGAPKHAGGGPLIKSVHHSKVELALWSTVLPWETSRGLSFISKELLENGRWGKLLLDGCNSGEGSSSAADGDDIDDLAVVSQRVADGIAATAGGGGGGAASSSSINSIKRMNGGGGGPLDGSNGMLFVHRSSSPGEVPHFWSGAIQCPLDVAFLSIPTPMEELSAISGLKSLKTGLNPDVPYQRLDQTTPGFGPLDDPLIYSYFLNERTRALKAGESPRDVPLVMPMRVEDTAILDPFTELEGFDKEKMALNDGTPFDGQHMFMDGRAHRCNPRMPRRSGVPPPSVTAVLEVRKNLFRDAARSVKRPTAAATTTSFSSPHTQEEENERVSFTVELGADLMREMKSKEHLYKDVIETLDRRCAALLLECEKPVGWSDRQKQQQDENNEGEEEGEHQNGSTTVSTTQLRSWREGNNEGSSARELSAGNPSRLAPSFLGSDGTKKSAFFTSITRYPTSSPTKPSYPPLDVKLLSLAFTLSIGVDAIPRLLGRLEQDLDHDSQISQEEQSDAEKEDPTTSAKKWRISTRDVGVLVELVRNPAVALPSSIAIMILNEAARRDII